MFYLICIKFSGGDSEIFRVDDFLGQKAMELGFAVSVPKKTWKAKGRKYLDYDLGMMILDGMGKDKAVSVTQMGNNSNKLKNAIRKKKGYSNE